VKRRYWVAFGWSGIGVARHDGVDLAAVMTMLPNTYFRRAARIATLIGVLTYPGCGLGAALEKNLSGTVRNAQHQPLPSAVVKVENQTTGIIRSYIIGADGSYFFRHLNGDTDFLVWARSDGHNSHKKTLSHFDTNLSPIIDFKIDTR
jgi:hypothetical protein